jgi:macrodomain Ter protein organizer (MatP/YcbG family)
MAVTTIKVETTLRDRLNLIAREQGVSVSRALETMVAERERAERFRQLREDMATLSTSGHDEYLAEATAWDSTLMDGLDESRNG